jgi:peptidoglycan/LPS O-acetylase OafA/YrhL
MSFEGDADTWCRILMLTCLAIAFAIVAGGNSLFGLFHMRASQFLGEISYSVYLCHGIFLFVVFHFILRVDNVADLSPFAYWGIIVGSTPVLIFLCSLTFRWIETPALRNVGSVTNSIRDRITWNGVADKVDVPQLPN